MNNTIGENLAFYRRKKGLTQKQIAESVGLSITFISQIENGLSKPSDENLKKIAQTLDISVNELISSKTTLEIKNENIELLKLLISITRAEKIKWEKDDSNNEIYTCAYKTSIRGTDYELGYSLKYDIYDGNYIELLELNLYNSYKNFEDNIVYDTFSTSTLKQNDYLIELLNAIESLDRDKSPKFKLINELEKIDKDDNATPDSTSVPF